MLFKYYLSTFNQFTTCMTIGAQIKLDKAHLPLIFPDLGLGMQEEENNGKIEIPNCSGKVGDWREKCSQPLNLSSTFVPWGTCVV